MRCPEIWKPVVGYPVYEVSDLGRIRRLPGRHRRKTSILKTPLNRYGYLVAPLWDGRRVMKSVHTLVLESFVGPRPSDMECRHLNGDKSDARLVNLAWGTPSENASDKKRHGTMSHGESHGMSKLTEDSVRRIISLLAEGTPQHLLAAQFSIDPAQVSRIATGKAWTEVPR